jgi:hypothetical protein
MNIQLASAPEVLPDAEAKGLCITVPLTARPDEVLLDAINASPAITAYCASVEPEESTLILVLKKDAGPDGLGTLMTAVSSLIELSNKDREAAAKTEEERRLEELERAQADAQAALQAWWESRS